MTIKSSGAAVVLAVALVLAGCSGRDLPGGGEEGSVVAGESAPAAVSPGEDRRDETAGQPEAQTYIDTVVQDTIAQFAQPGMGEYEKAKAAFDYLVETTTLVDPVGLEIWRVRGENDPTPSFVENRGLSVLLYQVGMCEDYAAALTLLLQGMGIEAAYVPGLTYNTQGVLVDHAWTIAKIDGTWYHLDCQLEQNISKQGSMRYKYFMKGDGFMSGSHRWGQNLIGTGLLTAAQNDEIAQFYTFEACPQDYPTPERHTFVFPTAPDRAALEAEIAAEIADYEAANGVLPQLELNIIPPVFALEGFGPQE